jgi:hypothetical protein
MDDQNGHGENPSSWQVAEALISNVRDITRRAETDSLLFVAIIVGFLITRGAGASSLSIVGLQITNPQTIQLALPPLAAFLALRYAKAERLSASIGRRLRNLLDGDLPSVPLEVSPPDWDVVRDVAVRMRSASGFFPIGASVVMFGLVGVGVVVNLLDLKSGSGIYWAAISGFATVLIILTMLFSRPVWSSAVIARSPLDD